MKMPRVQCGRCGRAIAAGTVAGCLGRGRLWRHDAPDMRARHRDALVSCPGSLDIVDLPMAAGRQLAFLVEDPDDVELEVSTSLF